MVSVLALIAAMSLLAGAVYPVVANRLDTVASSLSSLVSVTNTGLAGIASTVALIDAILSVSTLIASVAVFLARTVDASISVSVGAKPVLSCSTDLM